MTRLSRMLACALKGHDWTQWEYEKPNACLQIRTCKRDGRMEERTEHVVEEWKYSNPTSCDQVRVCSRCGVALGNRIDHDFINWYFVKKGACEQERSCRRCNCRESRVEHDFVEAGEREEVIITPPGTDWQLRYEAAMLRCRRCGEVTRKLLGAI